MKLVMAIIHDEDAHLLMKRLLDASFSVTKLSSTGGFLRSGNTTLIIGTRKERLDEVIDLIRKSCESRTEIVSPPNVAPDNNFVPIPMEVRVGGATVFVVDVEDHYKF